MASYNHAIFPQTSGYYYSRAFFGKESLGYDNAQNFLQVGSGMMNADADFMGELARSTGVKANIIDRIFKKSLKIESEQGIINEAIRYMRDRYPSYILEGLSDTAKTSMEGYESTDDRELEVKWYYFGDRGQIYDEIQGRNRCLRVPFYLRRRVKNSYSKFGKFLVRLDKYIANHGENDPNLTDLEVKIGLLDTIPYEAWVQSLEREGRSEIIDLVNRDFGATTLVIRSPFRDMKEEIEMGKNRGLERITSNHIRQLLSVYGINSPLDLGLAIGDGMFDSCRDILDVATSEDILENPRSSYDIKQGHRGTLDSLVEAQAQRLVSFINCFHRCEQSFSQIRECVGGVSSKYMELDYENCHFSGIKDRAVAINYYRYGPDDLESGELRICLEEDFYEGKAGDTVHDGRRQRSIDKVKSRLGTHEPFRNYALWLMELAHAKTLDELFSY